MIYARCLTSLKVAAIWPAWTILGSVSTTKVKLIRSANSSPKFLQEVKVILTYTKKMNVLIPMAGLGSRFAQEGYLCPKPLVKVEGEPLLARLLACLDFHEDDHLFIPYLTSLSRLPLIPLLQPHCSHIRVVNDLGQHQSSYHGTGKVMCTLIEISLPTRGAVETLFLSGKMMGNLPLISLDCDNIYQEPILAKARGKTYPGLFYFPDTQKNPIYSYIETEKVGEHELVLSIREKEKISNRACSGVYYFPSTSRVMELAEHLLHQWSSKELYLSALYNHLLKTGEKVWALPATPISFGIPMAVETFSRKGLLSGQKTICFDLDLTLVTAPQVAGNYRTCEPIQKTCDFLRSLYSKGHIILIHTARGMKTYGPRAEQVHRALLEQELREWKIPYHQLIFGKPYADFYIDDKAVSTFSSLARETGFYTFTTPPNMTHQLECVDNVYVKKGALEGEYWWYRNIPSAIIDLFPPLLPGSTVNMIRTPKIDGVSFSDKFLSGTLTVLHLQALFHNLERIHRSRTFPGGDIYANYLPKLKLRMGSHREEPLYQQICAGLEGYKGLGRGIAAVIHGDPVFPNIFLTSTSLVLFIDMRGKQGADLTIYGDQHYDYAKVYQSLTGYDAILHQTEMPSNMGDLLAYFEKVMGEKMKWIYLLTASLYYTLIPLHTNESPDQLLQYRNMAARLMDRFHSCK